MKEGYGRVCSNLTRTRELRVRPCKGFLSPQTPPPPGAWLPFPWICLQAPTCRQASVGTLIARQSFLKEVPPLPESHIR